MDRERKRPERGAARWWAIGRAVLHAPLALTIALTLTVLGLAVVSEADAVSALARTASAALVFLSALIGFTLTFGLVGIGLLLAADQRGVVTWAWTGALLGVVAAMAYGLAVYGSVMGSEMTSAGLLSAALFLLIRHFAGISEGQRPS